ncbi:hypothetical protein AQ611_10180 [Burkholderia singularis]|nr:hypothetical protein AQ611_10180 [Burkholderia sp. Bp7605]
MADERRLSPDFSYPSSSVARNAATSSMLCSLQTGVSPRLRVSGSSVVSTFARNDTGRFADPAARKFLRCEWINIYS